ncbi:MAG: LamG-like jellyroll fold domain-containing protein [Bacteroidales bacterium]
MKKEIRLTKVLLTGLFLAVLLMTSASIYAQNSAIEFDGRDDYVQLSEILTIGNTSNTIEAWVKVPEPDTKNLTTGERVGIILGNFDNDPNAGWEIHNKGEIRLWWNGGEIDVYATTTDLRDNEWHHVAFVRDVTEEKMILYVDGEEEGLDYVNGAGSGADIDTFNSTHRIGADNRSSGTPHFHGKMAEIRIWNTARTQEQIQENMNSLGNDENGLVAHYTFDNISGTTLPDNIGDNQGTLYNFALDLATQDVTDITTNSAVGNASIDGLGIQTPTAHGFCWNTSGNPTIDDNSNDLGSASSIGTFSAAITGFTSNTTYYVRAYATDDEGTIYGEEVDFSTLKYFEGAGTEDDPYQIADLDDLQYLSEHSGEWAKHFIQTADIDASETSGWNENGNGGYYGFSPIGTRTLSSKDDIHDDPFTGSFDGQGHTITGLFIDRATTDCVGLFGLTKESEIRNVGLVDVDVTGSVNIGGLIGSNGGSIENSHSTGSVDGRDNVGGLVGYTVDGINNSFSTVDVTGDPVSGYFAGGLVGRHNSGTINNSYATGNVNGGERVGGLVGQNEENDIINSYAAGAVSGISRVGGLAGETTGNFHNSFWDTETSGQTTSAGGTGKTTAEMKDINTFLDAGWDIAYANGTSDPVWQILDPEQGSVSYPFLFANHFGPYPGEEMIDYTLTLAADPVDGGTVTDVTDDAPYNIGDEVEIKAEANDGWSFVNWIDDDGEEVSSVATHTYTMPAGNATFTANFEQKEYPAENFGTALNGGTLETDKDVYHYGDIAVLTAIPDEEYKFIAWTGNFTEAGIRKSNSSENNPIEIIVDDETDIQAVFNAAPIPLSNWALYLGFILMVLFVAIRFRGSIF